MEKRGFNRRRFIGVAMGATAGVLAGCSPPESNPEAAAPDTAGGANGNGAEETAPTATRPTELATPTSYQEAPMLAEMVAAGQLPPVEERLPEAPLVMYTREEIGQFGGTWRRGYTGLADRWGFNKLVSENMYRIIQWPGEPPYYDLNIAESVEVNDDATEYVFTLRRGMKWSDGEICDTEDVRFWYEDVFLNPDLTPSPDPWLAVGGEPLTIEIVDDVTFRMTFAAPNPLLVDQVAKAGPSFVMPEHYLRNFHATYAPPEQLNAAVAQYGVADWTQLWSEAPGDYQGPVAFWFLNPELPVIHAWRVTVPAPAQQAEMERNPYYWKVDEEGNQLPYIDGITHRLVEDIEILNFMVLNGEIDCQGRHLNIANLTLFRENEEQGDYRVLLWQSESTLAYYPNMNVPDPNLRTLFRDARFRQALSVSMDREEINNLIFNGLYTPRQASPIPESPQFDEEFSNRWAEFDPDLANQLLDEIGLTQRGGDGFRLNADGSPLALRIEHTHETGDPQADQHLLVRDYWQAVGLRTDVRLVERSLYETLCDTGEVIIGSWGMDRNVLPLNDPGRYLAYTTDGPWAPLWGQWFYSGGVEGEEPPPDHPIMQMWDLWGQVESEPDEEKRNALFQDIIDLHKENPYCIGTVGYQPSPYVAKNNFRNIVDGLVDGDGLQNQRLIPPNQCFFRS